MTRGTEACKVVGFIGAATSPRYPVVDVLSRYDKPASFTLFTQWALGKYREP